VVSKMPYLGPALYDELFAGVFTAGFEARKALANPEVFA